jgi:hypothetical protein
LSTNIQVQIHRKNSIVMQIGAEQIPHNILSPCSKEAISEQGWLVLELIQEIR